MFPPPFVAKDTAFPRGAQADQPAAAARPQHEQPAAEAAGPEAEAAAAAAAAAEPGRPAEQVSHDLQLQSSLWVIPTAAVS